MNLNRDNWLSNILKNNVYNLSNFANFDKNHLTILINELCEKYAKENVFIFTKIKTDLIEYSHLIEDLGFRLIDTNILFQRNSNFSNENKLEENIEIKFAEISHKSFVGQIAYDNFIFSRFHLDPFIKNIQANNLKRTWVENYFMGERGDHMVIALHKDKPIAFLQLIQKENNLIIDLIAVSYNHRGNKIGTAMIYFASKNLQCEKITVGTQISNMPSIKLYQNLGFKQVSSDYVFHYHKK